MRGGVTLQGANGARVWFPDEAELEKYRRRLQLRDYISGLKHPRKRRYAEAFALYRLEPDGQKPREYLSGISPVSAAFIRAQVDRILAISQSE
jgi:hypothetical protein